MVANVAGSKKPLGRTIRSGLRTMVSALGMQMAVTLTVAGPYMCMPYYGAYAQPAAIGAAGVCLVCKCTHGIFLANTRTHAAAHTPHTRTNACSIRTAAARTAFSRSTIHTQGHPH